MSAVGLLIKSRNFFLCVCEADKTFSCTALATGLSNLRLALQATFVQPCRLPHISLKYFYVCISIGDVCLSWTPEAPVRIPPTTKCTESFKAALTLTGTFLIHLTSLQEFFEWSAIQCVEDTRFSTHQVDLMLSH